MMNRQEMARQHHENALVGLLSGAMDQHHPLNRIENLSARMPGVHGGGGGVAEELPKQEWKLHIRMISKIVKEKAVAENPIIYGPSKIVLTIFQ